MNLQKTVVARNQETDCRFVDPDRTIQDTPLPVGIPTDRFELELLLGQLSAAAD